MKMKYLGLVSTVFATICLFGVGVSTAKADLLDDIMNAKKIRISTDLALPPSGMVDGNLKPIGSDVETAQLLAKDWGLELEFIQTTGATRIPNLQTGKADIVVSTLSVTPERAKVIDFSKPYAALQSVVAALKNVVIKDWGDLKGKTITVTRGTTQDTELTAMSKEKGFTVIREGMRNHLAGIDVGFSTADMAIAETATCVLECQGEDARLAGMVCEIHVIALPKSRIVNTSYEAEEYLHKLMSDGPMYTAFISGPSRTADIERVLTIGVHGPLELHVALMEG